MRTARRALGAASIILAAILALSCNNAYGIFSNVQQETKQEGTKVFKKTPVSNAFRLGQYYYAATATLNRRGVAESSWTKLGLGLASYSILDALLYDSAGPIYVLLDNNSAGNANPSRELYYSSDGDSWTKSNLDVSSFDAIYAAHGQLFAESHAFNSATSASSYALYHYNSGSSSFELVDGADHGFAPAVEKTVRGVVYDSVNARYWFASEDKLYSGALADGSDAVDSAATAVPGLFPNGGTTATTLWDISYAGSGASGALYVSTKGGTLFRYQGGASTNEAVSSVPLTTAIEVPVASGSSILVGTDTLATTAAVGYYEGSFGSLVIGSSGVVAGSASVYSITVSAFPVHAFYYDGDSTKGILFVCVSPGTTSASYYGLYSSEWNANAASPNTWSGWSAE